MKIIFRHSRAGLKTAIRRNLGVRDILFEKVKKSDDSYHTEVHLPCTLLENYKQLLEPVIKVYGEPSNLCQHHGAVTSCCSYIDGINHRSMSSCMDETAQNETGTYGGLANNFMKSADKMTTISSIATNAMSALAESFKQRSISVYCMANIEPKSINLVNTGLDQFMHQVEQMLFPEHFGQSNCNYPRYAFDMTKLDQHLALTSSDLGTVKDVLVVGSRDIEAFKSQYPRTNASAGNDLNSIADSGNQTSQVNILELELQLKIEQEKTRQQEEKTKQQEEKTKQLLIELARDRIIDLAGIGSPFK
jgi:hypothetical protein